MSEVKIRHPWQQQLHSMTDAGETAGAEPERVKKEIEDVVGLDCKDALLASAKQVGSQFSNGHMHFCGPMSMKGLHPPIGFVVSPCHHE